MKIFLFTGMMLFLMTVTTSLHAQEAYAVEQDGVLTFYCDENRSTHTEGEIYNVQKELKTVRLARPSWCSANVEKVVFDNSFAAYTVENLSEMFLQCYNLTEIENMHNLNTSETKKMSRMFEGCNNLESIDLTSLDVSKVESMWAMFYECSCLKYVDMSGLDTKNVKDMSYMFGYTTIKKVNLSDINTSSVTTLKGMFTGCRSLKEVDLSSFDTHSVTNMENMFHFCEVLSTIYVGDGWSIDNVRDGSDMFLYCKCLVGGNGTKCDWDFWGDTGYKNAVVDTEEQPGYLTYKASSIPFEESSAYTVLEGGVLTFYYDANKDSHTGTAYNIEAEYAGDGNFPAWQGAFFTKVVFDGSFANYAPTSTARWFHSCSTITAFEGMENLNTSQSKSMSSMFFGCNNLKSIDLSNMNTSSATAMATMFYECSSLESLDLSGFDTRNVTAMTAMFYGCTGLKQLNVSSFNTSNVEDMQYMFFCCSELTSLDVTSFDTRKVVNMERMFSNDERYGSGCLGKLTSLDLSSFNTAKVTNMERMFQDNVVLTTIYVSNDWSTESVTDGDYMFFGCLKLVGGAGTYCDGILRTDYTWAHIDSEDNRGYFTDILSVGIADLSLDNSSKGLTYTIGGRLTKNTKGIVIQNGKKSLMK